MSDVSRATQMFRYGCACSQAILRVYGTPLGLTHDQAMRVAAGGVEGGFGHQRRLARSRFADDGDDLFLADRLGLSRAQTRRLLARGAVRVAGRSVAAARGFAAPRSKTKTRSSICSWPAPTPTCCSLRIAAKSTGRRSTQYRKQAGHRAARPGHRQRLRRGCGRTGLAAVARLAIRS